MQYTETTYTLYNYEHVRKQAKFTVKQLIEQKKKIKKIKNQTLNFTTIQKYHKKEKIVNTCLIRPRTSSLFAASSLLS